MMMNTNILKAQTNLKTCGPIDFVLQLQLEILIDKSENIIMLIPIDFS